MTDRLTVQAGAVTSSATIPAPIAVRALVSGLLAVVAFTRAVRAAYVLTPDTLILRDVLSTRTIPKSDIVGFPAAATVERRDSRGSTQRQVSLLFREDRALGADERALALASLRHWLRPEPEATAS